MALEAADIATHTIPLKYIQKIQTANDKDGRRTCWPNFPAILTLTISHSALHDLMALITRLC